MKKPMTEATALYAMSRFGALAAFAADRIRKLAHIRVMSGENVGKVADALSIDPRQARRIMSNLRSWGIR